MKFSISRLAIPAAAIALLLSGCATTFTVDSTVQAYSSLPATPAQPTYRFERLPSQMDQPQGQDRIEAMADAALFKAGLRRDDSAARYTVQVSGRTQRILSPWADPWDAYPWGGVRFGYGFGWRSRHSLAAMELDSPWFHREASLVVREIGSSKVVFESKSIHDGPWTDNAAVFPAMFEAALAGFPQPPVGPRRVDVTVAPVASAAPAAPATRTP